MANGRQMRMNFEENGKKKAILIAQKFGDLWVISGDTFKVRYMLGANGGKWDKEREVWVYENEFPEAVRSAITIWLDDAPALEPQPVDESPAQVAEEQDGETSDIVKPSYWDLLMTYTTPNRCRPGIALVGPAGNGKTTVAEEVLRVRGIEYIVIDANVSMEPFDLIGGMSYATQDGNGGQVWVDGPVTRAFREGKGVIINEFDTIDPRTALCLQSALQGKGAKTPNRYITLSGNPDEDRVYPAGDCPIILTMNTFGSGATRQYTGRNTLDAASRDRLTILSTQYENEDVILRSHGYSKFTATRLLLWATEVRTLIDFHELPVILGMRGLLAIAELVEVHGIRFEKALEAEFYSSQEPDTADLLRKG